MRDRPFDEVMIEHFRDDPAFAATLINSILEDGDDQGELKILLRIMASAFGDDSAESQAAQNIKHLAARFRSMGFELSVAPIPAKPRRRASAKQAKATTPKRAAHVRRTASKVSAALI